MTSPHPFPYFGHGQAYARKCLEMLLVFEKDIPKTKRRSIERMLPKPLSHAYGWGRGALHCGSGGDTYEFDVFEFTSDDDPFADLDWGDPEAIAEAFAEQNDGMPDGDQWDAFEDMLEASLRKIHVKYPLALVFKPSNSEYGDFSNWHDWSVEHFLEHALPWFVTERMPNASTLSWASDVWSRSWRHQLGDRQLAANALRALLAAPSLNADLARWAREQLKAC